MVLQTEVTKYLQEHMGNTFKSDSPYGLPSIFPFLGFILLWVFFSQKHLTLGIPLIITNSLNAIPEPVDSLECQTVATSMRPTRATSHSVIPTSETELDHDNGDLTITGGHHWASGVRPILFFFPYNHQRVTTEHYNYKIPPSSLRRTIFYFDPSISRLANCKVHSSTRWSKCLQCISLSLEKNFFRGERLN